MIYSMQESIVQKVKRSKGQKFWGDPENVNSTKVGPAIFRAATLGSFSMAEYNIL